MRRARTPPQVLASSPDERALCRKDARVSLVHGEDVFDGRLERVARLLAHLERRGPVQTGELAPRGVIAQRVQNLATSGQVRCAA